MLHIVISSTPVSLSVSVGSVYKLFHKLISFSYSTNRISYELMSTLSSFFSATILSGHLFDYFHICYHKTSLLVEVAVARGHTIAKTNEFMNKFIDRTDRYRENYWSTAYDSM